MAQQHRDTQQRLMAESAGIEPADPLLDHGLASRCLHHSANSPQTLASPGGIEPPFSP